MNDPSGNDANAGSTPYSGYVGDLITQIETEQTLISDFANDIGNNASSTLIFADITAIAILLVAQPPTDSAGVIMTGAEPAYNAGLWNGPNYINGNNCYAYAVNDPIPGQQFGHGQPGAKAGIQNQVMSVGAVTAAAVADGLIFLGMTPADTLRCPQQDYVIALVIAPGVDYHWYCHNKDGTWSGKDDSLPATNLDAAGHKITDPRTSNNDWSATGPSGVNGANYTQWGGYFAVPPNFKVKP